jgi:hypothetical protein
VSVLGALLATACASYHPPRATPPAEREPTTVHRPFARVWDAAIDHFSAEGIPLQTLERTSGLMLAERPAIPSRTGAEYQRAAGWADCGEVPSTEHAGFTPVPPTSGRFSIRIRPADDSTTTVAVTARFLSTAEGPLIECVTRGRFELETERAIRERAERG